MPNRSIVSRLALTAAAGLSLLAWAARTEGGC
jgi:hypothetical protein